MSTYVFSDVHGHRAALERALARVSPRPDDAFFCLGDMIDRGPDPLGVISLVRSLPNVRVLMGNHEDLMLRALGGQDGSMATVSAMEWTMNGGTTTQEGLEAAGDEEAEKIVRWVSELPCWAHTRVGERDYILTHAGLDPWRIEVPVTWSDESIAQLMAAQRSDDLLWIREDFWGCPTGLVDARGKGPIVIAGHTPTPYLDRMTDEPHTPTRNDDGLAQMSQVGACEATGGVADRWDIDAGAAGGAGFGQVLVLRLDDGARFYEPIAQGE